MFCEKCGNQLNDADLFCTKCGNKVNRETVQQAAPEQAAPAPAEVPAEAPAPVEAPVQEAPVEANPAYVNPGPTPAAEAVAAGMPPQEAKAPKAPKAGGNKLFLLLGGIGAAALVVAIVVIALMPRITNFVKKTFGEPEEYYAYVEEESAKTMANSASSVYDQLVENVNSYDRSVSGSVNVELTESGKELISLFGLAGLDMSWLQSGTLDIEGGVKNNNWSGDAALALNGDNIISANAIFSLDEQAFFLQIPELGKKYFGLEEDELDIYFDLDDDVMEEMVEAAETNEALAKALPSGKTVKKLTEKYMNIIFENMSNVDMGTKTLRAEGISQECTELEVTIDDDVREEIVEAVLNALREDEDVKKIIEDVAEAYGDDPESEYQNFLYQIDYYLSDLSYYATEIPEGTLTVWVDGAGNVVGRSWEEETYYGTNELKWIMPKQGSKFGFELSYTEYGETVSIIGSGKESGSKLSGEFEVEYNGTALVDISVKNFNTDKAKEGFINGEFTVSMASGLSSMLGMYSGATMLTDAQLVIDSEMAANKANVEVTLIYDEETAAVVTVDSKMSKGSAVSTPKDKNVVFVDDEESFAEWLEEMDYEKFVEKLSKTDLPEEFIEALEEYDSLEELINDIY